MRFKIDWASLIFGSKFTVFALFYFVFEGNFLSTSPRGAYIWEGRFNGGFFALPVWWAYLRNFTVILPQPSNTSDVQLRVQIVNLSKVVYRPPESGAAIGLFFEEFSSLLEEVVVCSEELLIIGDFNFDMDDTADRYV